MSATTGSPAKSILIFAAVFVGVFAVTSLLIQAGNEPKNSEPQPVAADPAKATEDVELQRKRAAEEQERARKDEAIAAEAGALLEAAREQREKQKRAELLKEQQEKEKAAIAKQKARKAELAAIASRDRRLRAQSASRLSAPRPIQVSLAGGTLEVSYQHSTLYMLTGLIDSHGSLATKDPRDGVPLYLRGGSSLQLLVSYTVNGERVYGTDDWFKIAGKPYKLSVTTSDEKVLKAKFVQTILEPVTPGEVTITVSLAGRSVKIPILVVPLNVALGESVDSVIRKLGLPDDDLFVLASWPESETVHNLHYYDDLRGTSRKSAHHWKFTRYPGAVVVVDGNKVVDVSSTSPEYVWPKDERQRFRDRLRAP